MTKSKLIGEFGEDNSPMSSFNVAKAMARAKEAAFILKADAGSGDDQVFRKLIWSDVAPPVRMRSESEPTSETLADETASDSETTGEVDAVEAEPAADDGWDTALKAADAADGRSTFDPAASTTTDDAATKQTATDDAAAAPNEAAPVNLAPIPLQPAVIDEAEKEKIREEAYQEGFSAGKAMTESAREAELDGRIADLDRVIKALSDPNLLDTEMFSSQIKQSVLRLATERAGSQIDNLPGPFLGRLETMLRNAQHMAGQRELFVSKADLEIIQEALPQYKDLASVSLHVNPKFDRGDVKLRVGGGEITDLFEELTPREAASAEVAANKASSDGSETVAAPTVAPGLAATEPPTNEVPASKTAAAEVASINVSDATVAGANETDTETPTPNDYTSPAMASEPVAVPQEVLVSEDVLVSEELLTSEDLVILDESMTEGEVEAKDD